MQFITNLQSFPNTVIRTYTFTFERKIIYLHAGLLCTAYIHHGHLVDNNYYIIIYIKYAYFHELMMMVSVELNYFNLNDIYLKLYLLCPTMSTLEQKYCRLFKIYRQILYILLENLEKGLAITGNISSLHFLSYLISKISNIIFIIINFRNSEFYMYLSNIQSVIEFTFKNMLEIKTIRPI